MHRPVADNAWELEPGLYRILLPCPLPAVPFANAYAIASQGRWALVDCGLDWSPSTQALARALRALGVAPGSLDHILITHRHGDHAGGAAATAARFGGQVRAHPAALAQPDPDPAQVDRWLLHHGVPPDLVARRPAPRAPGPAPLPAGAAPLAPGEAVAVGDLALEVIPTPGHAPDHVALWERRRGWLLAGDAVAATPGFYVWFPAWSSGDPLGQYLASLDRLAHTPCRLVLPGHGLPLPGAELPAVALALAGRHRARLERVRAALGDHPLTAWEVARQEAPVLAQSPDAVGRTVAEVLACLHHLAALGAATAHASGEAVRWTAA